MKNNRYKCCTFGIIIGITMLAILSLAGNASAAIPINTCTEISDPGEYILNQNIIDTNAGVCILITSSNVVFDGAGFTIDSDKSYSGFSYGVMVTNSSIKLTNVTVKNSKLTDWDKGIGFKDVTNGNITNNNVLNSDFEGVELRTSNNNTISGNIANSNGFQGILLTSSSNNNTVSGNIANSNEFQGIELDSSNNNTVSGNTANSNEFQGIELSGSNYNTISGNNANSNEFQGIELSGSNYNIISGNTANLNGDTGIRIMFDSYENIVSGNIVNTNGLFKSQEKFGNGIELWYNSHNNTISGNTIKSNEKNGIYIAYNSSNNTIRNNIVSQSGWTGIELGLGNELFTSNGNLIYNNNFNNTNNSRDDGNNTWNITKKDGTNILGGSWLGGNYWSDYAGNDIDNDGLGDTLLPYNSNGGIKNGGDYLPLVHVSVTTPILKSITVSPSTTTLNINETRYFNATAMDQTGAPMSGIIITWTSSDMAVGTVFPENVMTGADGNATTTFTAIAAGIAKVNATNGSVVGSAQVIVNEGIEEINLIKNSCFESGRQNWIFYTNGTGRFDIISPGFEGDNAAEVRIMSGGSNIQLYQKGLTLKPDTYSWDFQLHL